MEGSLVLSLIAGAAGGGLLLGGHLLAMRIDPRPCWQKNECTLRRADPDACFVCPVYLLRDVPVEAFVPRELNLPPLRRFAASDAEVA